MMLQASSACFRSEIRSIEVVSTVGTMGFTSCMADAAVPRCVAVWCPPQTAGPSGQLMPNAEIAEALKYP
jgi:hypothetical protein